MKARKFATKYSFPYSTKKPATTLACAFFSFLTLWMLVKFSSSSTSSSSNSPSSSYSFVNSTIGKSLSSIPSSITSSYYSTTDFKEENLSHSWRNKRETCKQWISAQRISRSYLDAYIIGVQKGATSELSMRLGKLGVLPKDRRCIKEWSFFEKLPEVGGNPKRTHLHESYTGDNLSDLRLRHYKTGFPEELNVTENTLPLVDDSEIESRTLVRDATVEYMLSDRVAFLAHLLTPHAKVILTMRNPLDRALSQYNMMIRIYNKAYRGSGKDEIVANAEQFHAISKSEMERLESCGYDSSNAELQGSTSELLKCLMDNELTNFSNLLYVTRGIYHIHIDTWRNYFPDHRMHYISFSDISKGNRQVMNDLSDFLCVRSFPEDLLKNWEEKGSDESFGQRAAKQGLTKLGFDSYEGKNKYLSEVLPKTVRMYEEFFETPNKKLEAMLGREMF